MNVATIAPTHQVYELLRVARQALLDATEAAVAGNLHSDAVAIAEAGVAVRNALHVNRGGGQA